MKTLILNIFGVLILFGLYACSDNSDNANDKTLVDIKWDLQSFEIVGGAESDVGRDRKSTRLNSSHIPLSRMPSSA